nr:hypothetical protein [Candidatus Sigynarchaeum springense]MDO8115741.1 hypothetical protein [Candidatus Sigynarchaeota archaeon]
MKSLKDHYKQTTLLDQFFSKNDSGRSLNQASKNSNDYLDQISKLQIRKHRSVDISNATLPSNEIREPASRPYLETCSLTTLREYARYHDIQGRSNLDRLSLIRKLKPFYSSNPSAQDWREMLGADWNTFLFPGCFLNKDHTIIIGYKGLIKELLDRLNICVEFIYTQDGFKRQDFEKRVIKDIQGICVKLNDFYYDFNAMNDIFRILGDCVDIQQDRTGYLFLLNPTKFTITSPAVIGNIG